MSSKWLALAEIILFFVVVFGWGLRELHLLRKARQDKPAAAKDDGNDLAASDSERQQSLNPGPAESVQTEKLMHRGTRGASNPDINS